MPSGKTPHCVDRTPIPCSLKHQNTRSFGVMWIVLNDLGSFYTFNEFPCKQPIGGQLVVSVLRDSDASPATSARVEHGPMCYAYFQD